MTGTGGAARSRVPALAAAPAAVRDEGQGRFVLQRFCAAADSAGDAGGEGINPGTAASLALQAAPAARNTGLMC